MIVVSEFPQLQSIAWYLRAGTKLGDREAFSLYERNWRYVDATAMTPAETALVARLTTEYGQGVRLV